MWTTLWLGKRITPDPNNDEKKILCWIMMKVSFQVLTLSPFPMALVRGRRKTMWGVKGCESVRV